MGLKKVGVQLVAEGANLFERSLSSANSLTDKFGSVASKASGGVDKLSVATVALGTALGAVVSAGLSKIIEGVTSFVGSGFALNNSLEQATAKLIAFTGSSAAAADVLAMVKARAAATPFEFDEMASSAAGLAAVSKTTGESLEGLLGIAERLAASNPAEGLEGAAFALREAFSGDFVSLQDRFNIPKDLIKRIKEGGITVAELDAELAAMGITTDLVSGLAATATGRISTFNDSVSELAGSLTEPVFEAFKTVLERIQPIIDSNKDSIKAFATAVGSAIGQQVLKAFQFLYDAVITFQMALAGNWVDSDIVQPFHRLAGIAGSVVGQFALIAGAFERLTQGKPIDSYIEAITRNLAEVFGLKLNTEQFNAITTSIGEMIDKIIGGVASVQSFVAGLSGMGAQLQAALPVITAVAAGLAAFAIINTVAGWIAGLVMGWGALTAAVSAAGGVIGAVVAVLGGPVTIAIGAVALAVGALIYAWQTDFMGIQGATAQAWAQIQPVFQQIGTWLQTNIPIAVQAATDAWNNTLYPALQNVWAFTNGSVVPLLASLSNVITTVQTKATELGTIIANRLVVALRGLWDFIANNILPIFASMQTKQDEITNRINVGFGPAIDGITQKINAWWTSLGGIVGIIQTLIGWLDTLAARIASIDFGGLAPGGGTGVQQGAPVPKSTNSYGTQTVDAPPSSYGGYSSNSVTNNSITIPITITGGDSTTYSQARNGVVDGLRSMGIG